MITRIFLGRMSVALTIAATSTLVSVRPSAAETEAQAYLRDPMLCWAFETLDEGTGTWGHSWPIRDRTFRGGINESQARVVPGFFGREGYVNKTNPSEISIVVPPNKDVHVARRVRQVPCPPPETASATGLYIGGELVKNWGWVRSTERLATTYVVTNQFSDRADPVGGGFLIGYKFAPWANNVIVSPFASFDFLNSPVNHTFPSGSYLGTTANFMGTGGVKIGPQLGSGAWLYGIAGVSVMNETLNINFIPVASSQSAWVAGGTVGVGGAFQPGFLQGFGHPVSVFAEYQHTWWQSANFNTPAASPLFNYNFARQDDVVKLGFTVSFGATSSPPAPSYPVKALPPK
jgi:hypothetical protein